MNFHFVFSLLIALELFGSVSTASQPQPLLILPDSLSLITRVTLAVTPHRVHVPPPLDSPATTPPISYTARVFEVVSPSGSALCPRDASGKKNMEDSDLLLRSQDYSVPGPTIVVVPGGILNLTLVNRLPVEEEDEGYNSKEEGPLYNNNETVSSSSHAWRHENRFGCRLKANTINLHTHGLHVDPSVDNPFRHIAPGSEGNYQIRIPEDHPPGTFFYHSHVHGATSLHMMSGLYGFLLVEYPPTIATLPHGPTLCDQRFTWTPSIGAYLAQPRQERSPRAQLLRSFMDYSQNNNNNNNDAAQRKPEDFRKVAALGLLKFSSKESASPFHGFSFDDLELLCAATPSKIRVNATIDLDLVTVNGALQPVWNLVVNQPLLVQFVYSAAFSQIRVRIPSSCEATVVAADGISYASARLVESLFFLPATRYDVVLICRRPGALRLLLDLGPVEGAYRSKARRYGIEEHVLLNLHVASGSSSSSSAVLPITSNESVQDLPKVPPSEQPHHSSLTPMQNVLRRLFRGKFLKRPSGVVDDRAWSRKSAFSCKALNDNQNNNKNCFQFDVSLAQKKTVLVSPTEGSLGLPAYQTIAQPKGEYSLGFGRNCDPLAVEQEEDPTKRGITNNNNSSTAPSCFFEPFRGARHVNRSSYHGFVVPRDRVVELRIFSDPEDPQPHPMHFHVHHFQLVDYQSSSSNAISPGAVGSSPARWGAEEELLASYGLQLGDVRDTIPILPGVTTIRWRAKEFVGEIVYHCHTLSHEDLGMMSSYLVVEGDEDDGGREGPKKGKPRSPVATKAPLFPTKGNKYSGIIRKNSGGGVEPSPSSPTAAPPNNSPSPNVVIPNVEGDDEQSETPYLPGWDDGSTSSAGESWAGSKGEEGARFTSSHSPLLLALLLIALAGGLYALLGHLVGGNTEEGRRVYNRRER